MKIFIIKLLVILASMQFLTSISNIGEVFAANTSIDFESSGGYSVTTTVTGTDTDWIRGTNTPYEGLYSIESADGLDDNQDGCFEVTNNVAGSSENLSFYYKVSSESGYDFLRFSIDGTQQNEWAGEIDWTKASYSLNTGNHTLKWCYEKDGSVSNGDDKARIDLIQIEMNPNQIANPVFHFDSMDINGDGNTTNNPNEGGNVDPWVDTYNGYNATVGTAPTYISEGIKTHSGTYFNGSSTLSIANQNLINTSSYDQKSFAIIFKTGNDITTLQNIYEQGGGTRGYAIQIEGGKIYAGVWNNNERAIGDQYKTLSANILANKIYRLIMVQDSTDASLANRTFEVILDGTSLGILNNVDVQQAHSGGAELGSSDGTIKLSDSSNLGGTGSNFTGNIGEFFSWNYPLSTDDINGVDIFLFNKWLKANFPPAPGGVLTNLQVWLKANKGTSTTTDGSNLNTWSDQSLNGYDATSTTAPIYLNNTTNNLNFNPVIDFNGTNQYMENLNNGAYSHSYFAVIIPDNQIDGTVSGQVPFGFDCESGNLNNGTCGLTFAGVTLGAFTAAINDEVVTNAIGSSSNWRSAQIGTASYEANKPMLISINENSTADGTDIYEKSIKIDNYTANTYQNLSIADYNIGRSPDTNYPFYYDGKIAEIINYNSRTDDTNRNKIESYLSIKYGITIDSGSKDYFMSDGITKFWSTSIAGIFINDIFGIARDDNSELSQIKSKSINNDSIITIEAIGEGTNITPSFTDIDDLESISISNNDLGNTWNGDDTPTGFYNLSRLWKIQENGEIGTINIDFDVDNLNFNIPDLSVGTEYYFTYDSNNNNSLADETPLVMTNTVGSIWQIADINLDNLMQFTISTESSSNNLPTDISLSNNSVNENSTIGTNVGNFTTTDADAGDTHTYSFVGGTGDDDNYLFSISGDTNSIETSADFEIKNSYTIRVQTDDGNGGQYQKSFIININNIGETTDSIIDFEESDDENRYNVTSGTWTRTTNNPNEGTYSIESSNSGDNTQSCFEVEHNLTATGTITFDYNVSSEANNDYLKFYIDNNEDQAWSGDVAWSTYTKNDISSGYHSYKWCYIKNGGGASGTDNAWIDYITIDSSVADITPPTITNNFPGSGAIIPNSDLNLDYSYSDTESGINTGSLDLTLFRWNGTDWGNDISNTYVDSTGSTINTTGAIFPTSKLGFGKYKSVLYIEDNDVNSKSLDNIFYIDEPEFIVSTGSIDFGLLSLGVDNFSPEITVTVKTIGAGFNVILNKQETLTYSWDSFIDWDGNKGFGFDQDIYSGNINTINVNEEIASEVSNINTDGNLNTYTYKIKLGANINNLQSGGLYNGKISFGINLNY